LLFFNNSNKNLTGKNLRLKKNQLSFSRTGSNHHGFAFHGRAPATFSRAGTTSQTTSNHKNFVKQSTIAEKI
jgi:hypothetical protein